MTKLQKLNEAKKKTLAKWERMILQDEDEFLEKWCEFCWFWQDEKCSRCPIRRVEGKPCFETYAHKLALRRHGENKTSRGLEKEIPFYLAVMVYIHGFTVADLPEEK